MDEQLKLLDDLEMLLKKHDAYIDTSLDGYIYLVKGDSWQSPKWTIKTTAKYLTSRMVRANRERLKNEN